MDIDKIWRAFSAIMSAKDPKNEKILRAMSDGVIHEVDAKEIAPIASKDLPEAIKRDHGLGYVKNLAYERSREIWGEDDYWAQCEGVYVSRDGDVYVIIQRASLLWRFDIDVSGPIPFAREPYQVEKFFTPTAQVESADDGPMERRAALQGDVSIKSGEDGVMRGLGIFSQSTINRDVEIDSTSLFDTFVERFESNEPIPDYYPTFGGKPARNRVNASHTEIELGDVKKLWRSGNHLIGYFEFDKTDEGLAAASSLERDTDGVWGWSIEFFPDIDESGVPVHEMISVSPEISVPAYTAGTFDRVSILKSEKAASHGTGQIVRLKTMDEALKKDLIDLVGEELAGPMIEKMDAQERAISESGVLTRAAEESTDGSTEEPTAEAQTETEENPDVVTAEIEVDVEDMTVEVDEGLMEAIVEGVAQSEILQSITQAVSDTQAQLGEALSALSSLTETSTQLAGEIRTLREAQGQIEEKQDGAAAEFAASSPNPVTTYRLAAKSKQEPEGVGDQRQATSSLLADRLTSTKVRR